jgi:hypothetical protein
MVQWRCLFTLNFACSFLFDWFQATFFCIEFIPSLSFFKLYPNHSQVFKCKLISLYIRYLKMSYESCLKKYSHFLPWGFIELVIFLLKFMHICHSLSSVLDISFHIFLFILNFNRIFLLVIIYCLADLQYIFNHPSIRSLIILSRFTKWFLFFIKILFFSLYAVIFF